MSCLDSVLDVEPIGYDAGSNGCMASWERAVGVGKSKDDKCFVEGCVGKRWQRKYIPFFTFFAKITLWFEFKTSRSYIFRALCERLETIDLLNAVECFCEMKNELAQRADSEQVDWILGELSVCKTCDAYITALCQPFNLGPAGGSKTLEMLRWMRSNMM